MWSKRFYCPFCECGQIPQMPVFQGLVRFVRDCRGWSPNRSQSRRATNCATPGYWVVLSGWAYSPKCRVLPTALHPVIQFVYPAGRILPNHPLCQSRWFQIFVLVHYSTVFWRFKVFSVCNFIVVIQKNFQKVRKDKVSITRFTPKGNYVTVKCSGGLKVTRENERIPPYRT